MPENQPSFLGPYEILSLLGQGGMGIVYLARHQKSGREVALKTLKVPKESFLRSLRREIDALASLRHPGIVRIFDQGLTPEEGLPWYAMELVTGKNLRQWRNSLIPSSQSFSSEQSQTQSPTDVWWTNALLEEQPTTSLEPPSSSSDFPVSVEKDRVPNILSQQLTQVSPSSHSPGSQSILYPPIESQKIGEVLYVVGQLCLSLAYLHGKGIIHRDLKPENILIRAKGGPNAGQPVLVDFGLASLWGSQGEDSRERLEESTLERSLMGTAYYMSPEQIRRQTLDARSDLYALGVLFYELLCGQHPLVGKTFEATLLAHLLTAPQKPSKWVSHLSKELETLLLSLLAKEKQERPGYAEDVSRRLSLLGATHTSIATDWPPPRPYLYRPRLVGRNALLAKLKDHLERWEQGEGALVLLGGESGVGKTRLVMELVRDWSRKNKTKARVWVGECEDTKTLSPLGAFRKIYQAIEDRCRTKGMEETERILGKRGPLLAHYQPSFSSLPGQEQYPPPYELPPKEARLRLFFALSETLTAFSKPRPFVLILDDLQWADELSLDFLMFLLRGGPLGRTLLILGTYRSEEVSENLAPLLSHAKTSVYPVPRLEVEAVAEMVSDMLVLSPAPQKLSDFLAEQSEGNPFFVAEYLRTAVEEGLLYRDETGVWQVKQELQKGKTELDYARLGLPRSLKDLVARWLDGLSNSARDWLFAAAILGKETSLEVLEEVVPNELRGLHELLSRDVLEESRVGFVKFSHDKLREGALAQLPQEQKPKLHKKAAQVLEQRGELREGVLGYHWEQAGEPTRAQAYYLNGARAATRSYSYQEAEHLYRAYLSLIKTPTKESIEARNELGQKVLQVQRQMGPATKEHTQSLNEARSLGLWDAEGNSLRLLGILSFSMGISHYEKARSLYEEALNISRQVGDRHTEGRTLGNLANLYRDQNRPEKSRILLEQALVLLREVGDQREEGIHLSNIANIYQEQGLYEESRGLYEEALSISRKVGDRHTEGRTLGNLASLYQGKGHYEKAEQLYKQALSVLREIGDQSNEGIHIGNLAYLRQEQGHMEEARVLYEQALSLLRKVGEQLASSVHLGNLANIYQELGHYQEAQDLYEEALHLLQKLGNRLGTGVFSGNFASLYYMQGRPDEARDLYKQALSILREIKDRRFEGAVLGELADLERRYEGNLKQGEQLCTQAISLLKEAPVELGLLLCTKGHLALAAHESAEEFLDQAKVLAKEIGALAESKIGKSIMRISRAQQAFDTQNLHLLFRGELWADIPDPVRQWLKENGQLLPQKSG